MKKRFISLFAFLYFISSVASAENLGCPSVPSSIKAIHEIQDQIYNPYKDKIFFENIEELITHGLVSKGLFVSTTSITDQYFLGPEGSIDQNKIKNFIDKYRGLDSVPTDELVPVIMATSKCLAIDPYVLTSLIKKESTFRSGAISSTGAAGLTQMTRSGIEEVHDQLGRRGEKFARAKNTKYFRETVIDSCLEQSLPNTEEFKPLWERGAKTLNEFKEGLKNDPQTSVVYGGILLKSLLAKCAEMNFSSERKVYQCALMAYNGDPGHMETYSEIILRDSYQLIDGKI